MIKYSLCFYENKEFKRIEYEKITKIDNPYDLKNIDSFTTKFNFSSRLNEFLYYHKLINDINTKIYLCKNVDNKYIPIYNTIGIIFYNDANLLNPLYIKKTILENYKNKKFIYNLMKSLEYKYRNVPNLKYLHNLISDIKDISSRIDSNYNEFNYQEIDDYINNINKLLNYELYKTNYKDGKLIYLKDKENNNIIRYKELHDLANMVKLLNDNKHHIKYIEDEEFLKIEDFDKNLNEEELNSTLEYIQRHR